jgi:predicted nucleic acid-binding Zn ribbon protein
MGRRSPRPAGLALRAALEQSAPKTGLAAVQMAWRSAVGEAIAAEAEPVAEREGVLTVRCRSSTWAQELSLMETEILRRLADALGEQAPRGLKVLAG